VATSIPHRTPSKVMMTMNILMAATISLQCPTHTTSTHKDPPTLTELTVSKANTQGIENKSFNTSSIPWEIITRISQLTPTNAVVDLLDDNDEWCQHMTFQSLSTNLDENKNIFHTQTPSCNDIDSFNYKLQLAAITARCKWMQQQWLLPNVLINQNHCVIQDDVSYSDHFPTPKLSSPWHIDTTLANKDAHCLQIDCPATIKPPSLLQQSQSLLNNTKQQSQALCNLMTLSKSSLCLWPVSLVSSINLFLTSHQNQFPLPPCPT